MLNWIWFGLIAIGVIVGGIFGRLGGEDGVVQSAFSMAELAVMGIVLPLMGFWMMWLGFMRLAEKAGLIAVLSRLLAPILRLLFPDVPKEHPAMGAIIMNMSANILGLGNAATPLGLKAMQHLDALNPNKGVATNSMCTFLAINTSSVTLIPATAVGILSVNGMSNPYAIVGTAIGATLCSTIVAVCAVKFFERLPVFQIRESDKAVSVEGEETADDAANEEEPAEFLTPARKVIAIVMVAFIALIGWFEFRPDHRVAFIDSIGLTGMIEPTTEGADAHAEPEPIEKETDASESEVIEEEAKPEQKEEPVWLRGINAVSVVAIPFVFLFFTGFAVLKRVKIYDEFVEGAKEGWGVAKRIMPFLVAMLVGIGIFRASGALSLIQRGLEPILKPLGFDPELLPMALIRPLSGGGSNGVLSELVANPDVADQVKYTAATMFGSTETTFYVLAVYFGSVAIRKTRHALAAGLCADIAGVIAAVAICKVVFGS